MLARLGLSVVVALVVLGSSRPALADGANSAGLVREYLRSLGAKGYTLDPIQDDYVAATFPGMSFFGVLFQRYPLTVEPPEGLSQSNVFVVVGDKIFTLKAPEDLKVLFVNQTQPAADVSDTVNVARTWLRLSAEFAQDGYFTFSDPGAILANLGATTTNSEATGPQAGLALTVRGRVAVTDGGSGSIHVEMVFDQNGQLTHVAEVSDVTPGNRPI